MSSIKDQIAAEEARMAKQMATFKKRKAKLLKAAKEEARQKEVEEELRWKEEEEERKRVEEERRQKEEEIRKRVDLEKQRQSEAEEGCKISYILLLKDIYAMHIYLYFK